MAIKINSNVQSLAAQRQVAGSSDSLGRVFERLSSGQRINRASDDAAGLAIASTIQTKVKVLAQANRNINDGVSALNVAQAALQSQNTILSRLSELAEQSANGTYNASQRSTMAPEYAALVKEYERISSSSTFNGQQVIGRTGSATTLQIGSDGSLNSSLTTNATDGSVSAGASVFRSELLGNPNNVIGNNDIFYFFDNVTSLDAFHDLIGGSIFHQVVTASDGSNQDAYFTMLVGRDSIFQPNIDSLFAFGITVDANGQRIGLIANNGNLAGTVGAPATSITVQLANLVGTPSITLALDIPPNSIRVITSATDSTGSSRLDATGVESQSRARSSLPILENIRAQNDANQGYVGSTLSRLATAQSVTSSSVDAYSAAESRIRDTDIAKDAAELTRLQILQQAGIAVLGQANLQPQIALKLLKN